MKYQLRQFFIKSELHEKIVREMVPWLPNGTHTISSTSSTTFYVQPYINPAKKHPETEKEMYFFAPFLL